MILKLLQLADPLSSRELEVFAQLQGAARGEHLADSRADGPWPVVQPRDVHGNAERAPQPAADRVRVHRQRRPAGGGHDGLPHAATRDCGDQFESREKLDRPEPLAIGGQALCAATGLRAHTRQPGP